MIGLFDAEAGKTPEGDTNKSTMRAICEFMISDKFYSNDTWLKEQWNRFINEKGRVTCLAFVAAIATAVIT